MKKSLVPLAVLVVALVGVAVVATFTPQFIGSARSEKANEPTRRTESPIRFAQTVADANRIGGPVCELYRTYHYAFWFENTASTPVQLGVRNTSCYCAKVEVGTLPKEWKDKLAAKQAARTAAYFQQQTPLNLVGPVAWERELAGGTSDVDVQWLSIKDKTAGIHRAVTIPAEAVGWIRLVWTGETAAPVRLLAEVWTEDEEAGAIETLEVQVVFTPPFRVEPGTLDVGILDADRTTGRGDVTCWSHTRPVFSLEVDAGSDSFVTCGKPVLLTEKERLKLAVELKTPFGICGYRVPVTVIERADGRQLDMGPFTRTIVLKPEGGDPFPVEVTGVVRSELKVGASERDGVVLGLFPPAKGTRKTVPLSTERMDLELEVDKAPDFLRVELSAPTKGTAAKTWNLTVTVPPGALNGPTAPECALYLRTKDQIPRRMRVPVSGKGSPY